MVSQSYFSTILECLPDHCTFNYCTLFLCRVCSIICLTNLLLWACVHIYIQKHYCRNVYIYICVCVYIYIYIYMYMCVCVYIYIYIYIWALIKYFLPIRKYFLKIGFLVHFKLLKKLTKIHRMSNVGIGGKNHWRWEKSHKWMFREACHIPLFLQRCFRILTLCVSSNDKFQLLPSEHKLFVSLSLSSSCPSSDEVSRG